MSLLDPFIEQLAADGITVDDSLVVAYGAADTDYKTLLQPIVSAGVDAIYCPNYTQQLVAIVTAATELGYEGKIVCGLMRHPLLTPRTVETVPISITSTTSIPMTPLRLRWLRP